MSDADRAARVRGKIARLYETALMLCYDMEEYSVPTTAITKACLALGDDLPGLVKTNDPLVFVAAVGIKGRHAQNMLRSIDAGGGADRLAHIVSIMKLGTTASLADKLHKTAGTRHAVAADPYKTIRAAGGRLLDADIVAKRLRMPDVQRAAGYVWWHLEYVGMKHGHAAVAMDSLVTEVRFGLGVPEDHARTLVAQCGSACRISDTLVAAPHVYAKERFVASEIARRVSLTFPTTTTTTTTTVTREGLDATQAAALETSLTHGLSVITGGPGTGKTVVARALVAAFGGKHVVVTAPTGRAARNMEGRTLAYHNTRQRECIQDMSTIPNDTVCIIVDESSMLTIELAESVFRIAPKDTCRIVLIGDVDQLPPIGIGHVFADLVRSDACPISVLTSKYRSIPGITAFADGIIGLRQHLDFASIEFVDARSGSSSSSGSIQHVVDGVMRAAASHPGAVVLTAINDTRRIVSRALQLQRRGDVEGISRYGFMSGNRAVVTFRGLGEKVCVRYTCGQEVYGALTDTLQSMQPVGGDAVIDAGGAVAYIGERVILTKNSSSELEACNGDIGTLVSRNVVAFEPDGRHVLVDPKDLALADALTVHKCQGSEFDTVIVAISFLHFWNVPLLYTAATRAKKKLVIVGNADDVESIAAKQNVPRLGALKCMLAKNKF
jgi:exodeoxyribonuclease V alpha subunit